MDDLLKLAVIAVVLVIAGAAIYAWAEGGVLTASPTPTVTPTIQAATHNATKNVTKNATRAATKAVTPTVKPTVAPTTPAATPDNRNPDLTVATPVATATPQDTMISAPHVITVPTATPVPMTEKQTAIIYMPPYEGTITTPPATITIHFGVTAKEVGVAGQRVTFDINGKQLGSATTGSNGMGTFTFSTAGLLPGSHAVGLTYAGNSQYTAAWQTYGITIA
jgi:hypothetical protein